MLDRIRNAFFSGLLVLAPAVITIYVVWRLFIWVDHLLGTTLRGGYIRPGGIPGLGFVTVLAIILVVGFLANNFLGRQVGSILEAMLMRVPFFRGFYGMVKQVGEAFLGEKRGAFQRVVLIEYPIRRPLRHRLRDRLAGDRCGARGRKAASWACSCRTRRTRPRDSFSSIRPSH